MKQMRDRLIEILKKFCTDDCKISHQCGYCDFGDLTVCPSAVAEHLLANGVIVPPCKVGDTVYVLDVFADSCKCADCDYYYAGGMGDMPECGKTRNGYRYHKCVEINEQRATMQSILCWLSYDGFGKTVFLTREEAEKVLIGD